MDIEITSLHVSGKDLRPEVDIKIINLRSDDILDPDFFVSQLKSAISLALRKSKCVYDGDELGSIDAE